MPKLGTVMMTKELRWPGSIREVAVNPTAGTWFACFAIEDGQDPPPLKDGPIIGVDFGGGKLAVCSDGTVVENPKPLPGMLKHLRQVG